VRINYWRISLRRNLSRKCHKIVKFMSITHSERNIWNGTIVATAIGNITRHAWEGLAGMGVSPGVLPCHTWGAHRMHLRSLWNCKHSSFKW
jgi:hypothetical protein